MASASDHSRTGLRRSRRDLRAWCLLAALGVFAALAAPFFAGRLYTADDLGAFHLPLRAFYAEQLARGEAFDWMPQLFCGFYITGEGQLGGYHPFHLVLYRFLPLRAAMAWELLASYPFMLAGTYWFLRRRLARRDAAMFGSLLFTFSGFNLLHFIHPNAIAIVAHIPWLLAAIDVLLTDPDRRRVAAAQAGIALLTASQLLLGYPQYVWLSLLAEAAYALVAGYAFAGELGAFAGELGATGGSSASAKTPGRQAARGIQPVKAVGVVGNCLTTSYPSPPTPLPQGERRVPRSGRAPSDWRRWMALAVALLAGGLAGGVQLLPTFDAVMHSARRAPDASFVNWGSVHPANLVQLVAPYLFVHRVIGPSTHESSCYLGAVPLVLIIWLLIRRRELGRLRTLALASAAGGGLAFLMAFGEFGPLYRFQRLLPLVGGFRCPGRYLVLCQLAASILAAIGLILLVRSQQRGERPAWKEVTLLGCPVGASILAAIVGLILNPSGYFGPFAAILAGPVLVAAAAGLVVLASRGVRPAIPALVLLAAADLACYGLTYNVDSLADRPERYLGRLRLPPAGSGRVLADLARADEIVPRTGNQMTMLGFPRADGYVGLEPLRTLRFDNLASLRAASVRWVRKSDRSLAIEGLVARDGRWLEVPGPLPRIRLVSQVEFSSDPRHDISRAALDQAALVDRPLKLVSRPAGVCHVLDERPGRFCVEVSCPSSQLLTVAESYHRGWKARLDGKGVEVLRINGDFLGCLVPPGSHLVQLDFHPDSLHDGRILSCLGLGLILACFAVERRTVRSGRPGKWMLYSRLPLTPDPSPARGEGSVETASRTETTVEESAR